MTSEYELSKEQYTSLWQKYNLSTALETIDERFKCWDEIIQPIFNIEYIETIDSTDETAVGDYPRGWFGIIRGDEKYINWFLMHL